MTDTESGAHLPPSGRDAQLAQRFVALADTLVDDFDLADLLDHLVQSCVELLGVATAGLLLVDGSGRLHPVAASTEATRVLELFQLQNDEGPCLSCVRTGQVVSVPDISAVAERWPRFSQAADANGFASVHALPMRLRQETIGSLNLFNTHPPDMTADDRRIAQALADVATIGILQQRSLQRASQVAEQLQQALNSRILIEQAKGVLAEHAGVDMATAFARLRHHARSHNLTLGDVAGSLIHGSLAADSLLPRRTE
jgi:GAF domain-containing protein